MSGFDSSWRHSRPGVLLALAVLLLATAACGTASAAVRILPLGDSITHGGVGDGGILYPSYRPWLYQGLTALGYDVDFVGSLDTPTLTDGLDPDNEGHPGYTAHQALVGLPDWLEAYPPPAIALVHLGTNDVVQGIPPTQTVADLRGIIAVLRARNPSMTILVAQIIPCAFESGNWKIEALNKDIAGLQSLSTVQSPVVIVDQYSGYDGWTDNQADAIHPLTSGEKKIAARWKAALIPVLDGLGPAPAILPVPPGEVEPGDLDGDRTCEDVNGNGRRDFADVVLFFNQMTWIAENEPVTAFDCNGNGRIDFADVVWLFNHL